MPTVELTRQISAEERAAVSKRMPEATSGWMDSDLLSYAAGMAMGLMTLFLIASGIVTVAGHLLASPVASSWLDWATPYGLVGSLVGGIGMAVHEKVREVRAIAQIRRSLSGDQVHATTYDIVAVKRYQEPEHGGLVYLLLTDDGRVLSVFDDESQSNGVDNKNPLDSAFRPKARIELVETLDRSRVINETWSGAELPVPNPVPLNLSRWPEHGEIVNVAWEACDHRFGARPRYKRTRIAN
jgi:hypothetical protein